MKISIASDLHLEFADLDLANPGSDVLVLAGDICTLRHLDSDGKLGERFRDFFKRCADRWEHVIYVLGNHESYGSRVEKSVARAREIPGITLLDNTSVEIRGIRFWGATLWADLTNPLDSIVARRFMNDYKAIRTQGGQRPLTPEDTTAWHRESVKLLRQCRPDVVVTHHAPSMRSIPPEFQGDVLNTAYASPLDDVVLHLAPRLWIHGHIHSRQDYLLGETRVVARPRGYVGHETKASLWTLETLDVD